MIIRRKKKVVLHVKREKPNLVLWNVISSPQPYTPSKQYWLFAKHFSQGCLEHHTPVYLVSHTSFITQYMIGSTCWFFPPNRASTETEFTCICDNSILIKRMEGVFSFSGSIFQGYLWGWPNTKPSHEPFKDSVSSFGACTWPKSFFFFTCAGYFNMAQGQSMSLFMNQLEASSSLKCKLFLCLYHYYAAHK